MSQTTKSDNKVLQLLEDQQNAMHQQTHTIIIGTSLVQQICTCFRKDANTLEDHGKVALLWRKMSN
ncbi:hypothetical protein FF38_13230 [Lucilia cuprina]|uniref:Uncharacterized protein n=1 Tax=Lucilia cuprina TaxID=7375 RepID=A0A0L0C7E6_LUCCU|nr:hypothetical protein FF38_13230 [Lucilia cuprina]